MLFSDENIYITLSYLLTAILFLALIGHSIWRARATKQTVERLSQQRSDVTAQDPTKENDT